MLASGNKNALVDTRPNLDLIQRFLTYHTLRTTAVEHAFGRLKGRRRCLLKQCEAHIALVSHIAYACCVLHNYCEVHNEEFLRKDDGREEEEEQQQDARPQDQEHVQGNNIRDALCSAPDLPAFLKPNMPV